MNKLKFILPGILIFLFFGMIHAQQQPSSTQMFKMTISPSGSKWLNFNTSQNIDGRTIFATQKETFGLRMEDDMSLVRTETDNLGFTHYRFQQMYKGLRIEAAEFIIHSKNGRTEKGNGKIIEGLTIDVNPSLSEEDALAMALAHINAEEYMWQDPEMETFLQRMQKKPTATYYPAGELIIAAKHYDMQADNFRLAYRFDIYAQNPLGRFYVDVDAYTGEVINQVSRIHTSDVAGTGTSLYDGNVNITIDRFAPGSYRLRETGRGAGIETFDMQNGSSYGAAVDFFNSTTDFAAANAQAGVSAHWGAENTYDYYFSEHTRWSYDGGGGLIWNFVHADLVGMGYKNNNNAFWDGTGMTYGDGNGTTRNPYVSLDIVGHEFTHAVNDYSANMVYQKESGALDESFCDIFGTAIEFYVEGTGANWRIGEDVTTSGNGIRNMSAPNVDTYGGTNWVDVSGCVPDRDNNDYCGVHTNSGVQNYWFYLLSQGRTGTNDNGQNYSVDGIGIDKAAKIAYRNLTTYLTPSSGYWEASWYARQAAIDLYGILSDELDDVANAWYAVGLTDVPSLSRTGNVFGAESWVARDFIVSNQTIFAGQGQELFAGDKITLTPGFRAQPGSKFRASILGN